jgi:hypothetical protein
LKYQICNLKSHPNPNQKPPCPREPPVVDAVALRLRLPAEQALCGDAMPIGVRMFPESTETGRNITSFLLSP